MGGKIAAKIICEIFLLLAFSLSLYLRSYGEKQQNVLQEDKYSA